MKYENLDEITCPIYFYSWVSEQKHVYTHCVVNDQKIWCFEKVSDWLFKYSATLSFIQSKCFPEASEFPCIWTQHMNMCWRTPGITHVSQPSQNYSSCDMNPTGYDYWDTRYLVKGWKNIKGTQTSFPKCDRSWKNLYITTWRIQHCCDSHIWATKPPPLTFLALWKCLFSLSETPVTDSWWYRSPAHKHWCTGQLCPELSWCTCWFASWSAQLWQHRTKALGLAHLEKLWWVQHIFTDFPPCFTCYMAILTG